VAIGRSPLSFDSYFSLLVSAVVRRDHQVGYQSRSRRTVNTHQVDLWEGFSNEPSDPWTVQVAQRAPPTPPRPIIAPELWAQLPPASQQILRSFTPKVSAPTRSTHLHDSSPVEPVAFDFPPSEDITDPCVEPETVGEQPYEEEAADDVIPSDPQADDSQPLLAHLTHRQMMPTGDVRRILAGNRGPTRTRPSSTPRPPDRRQGSGHTPKDIIVLNGKKYIQIDTHTISYSISHSRTTHLASLVDRGANGGMAGSDVC
jgi:hypothetical protein